MRIEHLSQHAGDALHAATQEHDKTSREADRMNARVAAANEARTSAVRSKPLWRRVLSVPTKEETAADMRLRIAEIDRRQAMARAQKTGGTVERRASGAKGEDKLTSFLAQHLSDEWLAMTKYLSANGRIDVVLVGLRGVWVIEVKYQAIRIHATGDNWRYDQLDRARNAVGSGLATYPDGRSWGRQASDVARALMGILEQEDEYVPVWSAVLIMHERAEVGTVNEPVVNFLGTDAGEFLRWVTSQAPSLSPTQQREIAGLIRLDHQRRQTSQSRTRGAGTVTGKT
jgi:hypothetical protein